MFKIAPKTKTYLISLVMGIFLVVPWYLSWKFFRLAVFYGETSTLYLQDRNNLIQKIASLYYTVSQIDSIITKLGVSTSSIRKNFDPLFKDSFSQNPFSSELTSKAQEELSAILLLQGTPLLMGSRLFEEIYPLVEAKVTGTVKRVARLDSLSQGALFDPYTFPSIVPVVGNLASGFGMRLHPLFKR